MKKIIRLTESDLVRLVKRVINEKKFENQSEVDRILDKISAHGIDSLTQKEKNILDNPDIVGDEEEYDEPENNDEFIKLYTMIKHDLNFVYTDFPQRWENVKDNKVKANLYKHAIKMMMEGISKGLNRLEEIGEPDSDEIFECNELFIKVSEMLKELFNEGQ